MYLEQRRRRWYALHDIPQDVQKALKRKRFVQSLETEDRRIAERRAAPLKVKWLTEIEAARKGTPDALEQDANYWRRVLRESPSEQKELVLSFIYDEAQKRIERAADRAGITDYREPEYDELPAQEEAKRFLGIATGKVIKLDEHLEEYLATLGNEKKTVDMKRSTIKRFSETFPYVSDVKRKEVQGWINQQAQDGKKPATLQRALSELRGYWSYLQAIEVAAEDALPLEKLSIPKNGKNGKADEREPFQPQDLVKLWREAKASKKRQYQQLADLIELGMWSGARIEELCALKVEKVTTEHFDIEDAKTAAGWRRVPVHSKLKATVKRLLKESKDGYLLSGLTANKYEDRSGAIGKRFGRLKTGLGFGERHVFHSIRHTVSTMLEDAGVPENVAADILGHDKPRVTYGLYSGGTSLKTKKDAIEKLAYPRS